MMNPKKDVIPVLARRSASARRRENGNPDTVPAKAGSQIDVMDSPHQVRGRLCWSLPRTCRLDPTTGYGAGMTENSVFRLFPFCHPELHS